MLRPVLVDDVPRHRTRGQVEHVDRADVRQVSHAAVGAVLWADGRVDGGDVRVHDGACGRQRCRCRCPLLQDRRLEVGPLDSEISRLEDGQRRPVRLAYHLQPGFLRQGDRPFNVAVCVGGKDAQLAPKSVGFV